MSASQPGTWIVTALPHCPAAGSHPLSHNQRGSRCTWSESATAVMIPATPASAQQLRPDATERLIASTHCFPVHLLPAPLLALVASHLPPVSLLRLQRCSTAHHRLRSHESYTAAAWRWAEMRLLQPLKLHEWALPREQCIPTRSSERRKLIPVSLRQAAVPALKAVLAKVAVIDRRSRHEWLRELMRDEQPTVWVWAKQSRQMVEDVCYMRWGGDIEEEQEESEAQATRVDRLLSSEHNEHGAAHRRSRRATSGGSQTGAATNASSSHSHSTHPAQL